VVDLPAPFGPRKPRTSPLPTVKFNPAKVDISFGPLKVAKDGAAVDFSEAKALGLLKRKEVEVTIDLHLGKHDATVFTSDLSYDYVKINASYRS